MSVVLQTGVIYYREDENDDWHPLIIKADTDLSSLVEEYDATATGKTWQTGELCLHDAKVYCANNNVVMPKAWTASDWSETTLGAQIGGVKNTLNQLDDSQDAIEDAIAYVQEGDTASRTYTAGQFVYLKNHATLAEGLYTVNSGGIPSGTTVTGHLTEDPSGGLNSLKNIFENKYATVTGTMPSTSAEATVAECPAGFNSSNCVIVGNTVQFSNSGWYGNYKGNDFVIQNGTSIAGTAALSGFYDRPCKIVLMKI